VQRYLRGDVMHRWREMWETRQSI